MKPTLFLLAAGMGSRYGGLKQLDTLGPQGQTIMDYSIYDSSSNRSTHFPKVSPAPQTVKSPGVQTTP